MSFPSLPDSSEHLAGSSDHLANSADHRAGSSDHLAGDSRPVLEPIAIIGIGCRYAGINDTHSFWDVLSKGLETTTSYPGHRFAELDRFYDLPSTGDGPPTRRGGFLPDLDQLDAEFFGISPREAAYLDPQQRLLLEVAYEALEDAGQIRDQIAGTKSGVFAGIWNNDYHTCISAVEGKQEFYTLTGGALFGAASRLSYFFDLQGPEFVINAGCASSLIAVHLACKAIRAGDCSFALAGGANAILRKEPTLAFKGAGALSEDGRCKFGDIRADGFVRSEGAGIVVLKPLSAAQRDGDRIHALILGSAINSDGHSDGLWVSPSQAGQERAIRDALREASLSADRIQYVEAHGTGTRAGDAAELNALAAVIGRAPGRLRPCAVGSAKTNIGHPESAAGVAGLIKATLALQHRYVPPTLHVQQLTPALDWETSGLYLPRQGEAWTSQTESGGAPELYALVNSFGLTGSNAHVVLSGPPAAVAALPPAQPKTFLLPVSAASSESLQAQCQLLAAQLAQTEDQRLWNLCYTAARRRNHLPWRKAVVGANSRELAAGLRSAAAASKDGSTAEFLVNAAEPGNATRVVFVFPGQGSQWVGMGRELYQNQPAFRQVIDCCEPLIQEEAGWSLVQQLGDEAQAGRLALIDVVQPTLFAVEIALAALWRSWGVQPAAVIGHSMGEVAAAFVAGILSLSDAVRIICRRSRLLLRTRGQGAMALVEATLTEAAQAIAGREDRLSIAVSNSARSTVLSGDPQALEEVLAGLEAAGVFCRKVKVDVASHSPQMDALTGDLLASLREVTPGTGNLPFYSTVTGSQLTGTVCDAAYWVRNLRQPVLFGNTVQGLMEEGYQTFVELSPHPLLLPSLQETFSETGRPGLAVGSLRREEGEEETLFRNAALLYEAGAPLAWKQIYPAGVPVDLPRYAWNRKRFWIEGADRKRPARSVIGEGHPLLGEGAQTADGRWSWTSQLDLSSSPWLQDHAVGGVILLPASAYAEMALAAGRAIFGESTFTVESLSLDEALTLSAEHPAEVQLIAVPDSSNLFTLRFFRKASEDGAWSLFATAALRAAEFVPIDPATSQTGPVLSGTIVSGQEHRSFMKGFGYDFGPSFQCVAEYWLQPGLAWGEVRLPEGLTTAGFGIHPVVLDAAFQMLGALLLRDGKLDQVLPIGVASIRQVAPLPSGPLFAVRATVMDLSQLTGSVRLLDAAGRTLVEVEGLSFQEVARSAARVSDDLLYSLAWKSAALPEPPPAEPGTYLVYGSEQHPLVASLRRHQCRILLCETDSQASVLAALCQSGPHAGQPVRGLIYLVPSLVGANLVAARPAPSQAAEEAAFAHTASLCAGFLQLLANLEPFLGQARLWLITEGAFGLPAPERVCSEPVGPPAISAWMAPFWGLAAVVDKERPALKTTCIDVLSPLSSVEAEQLAQEILGSPDEARIALRGGLRYVQRLQKESVSEPGEALARCTRPVAPGERFELRIRSKGTLDSFELHLKEQQTIGPGDVEIAVAMTALNFIDVATAMALGQITRDALGLECAGTVSRVGSQVTAWKTGDAVIAVSPSYQSVSMACSHVVVPSALVWKKPATLSMEQAAALPSVFMTAYYALVQLAHLQAGERVLIHAGSGGVGLAAIQIAQWIGAEVFATAGSEEKRRFLRELGVPHVMDSRSLQFGAEVRSLTSHRGVDVILNSLTGPAILEGLRSLAPYGRFVEIGKLDIAENTEIGLRPFLRNLSFFALDLGSFFTERRTELASMMGELLSLMEAGALHPLPVTVFPVTETRDAFHLMAAAKHIGKVVLNMQVSEQGSPAEVVTPRQTVRPDSTYLITGGSGALGLLAAEELAALGATHLALLGRKPPAGAGLATLHALRSAGTTATFFPCDLGDAGSLEAVLERVRATMPPLRGVIHSAGVLQDAILENLKEEDFTAVMAGKAYGASVLDRLTGDLPLDFFLLFSSVACVLGSAGQANYAAANAYLDALAHQRAQRGRPATSINWGPWSEIGLAAAQSNRGDRLVSHGLSSLTPGEGRQLFRSLLLRLPTQVLAMRFDAGQWTRSYPSAADMLFLEGLRVPAAAPAGLRVIDQIRAADSSSAQALLFEHVTAQVAAVLRLEAAGVPPRKAFRTMGLDSLLGLELRNRLERQLGLRIPATVIWNFSTVEKLSGYLFEKLGLGAEAAAAPVPRPALFPSQAALVPAGASSEADLLELELKEAEALLQSS